MSAQMRGRGPTRARDISRGRAPVRGRGPEGGEVPPARQWPRLTQLDRAIQRLSASVGSRRRLAPLDPGRADRLERFLEWRARRVPLNNTYAVYEQRCREAQEAEAAARQHLHRRLPYCEATEDFDRGREFGALVGRLEELCPDLMVENSYDYPANADPPAWGLPRTYQPPGLWDIPPSLRWDDVQERLSNVCSSPDAYQTCCSGYYLWHSRCYPPHTRLSPTV